LLPEPGKQNSIPVGINTTYILRQFNAFEKKFKKKRTNN